MLKLKLNPYRAHKGTRCAKANKSLLGTGNNATGGNGSASIIVFIQEVIDIQLRGDLSFAYIKKSIRPRKFRK